MGVLQYRFKYTSKFFSHDMAGNVTSQQGLVRDVSVNYNILNLPTYIKDHLGSVTTVFEDADGDGKIKTGTKSF